MKILYYTHALYIGGAEMLTTHYLIRLQEMGNEVVLVVNQEENSFLTKELTEKGIRILSLNPPFKSKAQRYLRVGARKLFGYAGTWEKIYQAEKPDVIHIHTSLDAFEMCDVDPHKVFYTFHTSIARSLSLGSRKNLKKIQQYAKRGMNFTVLSPAMVTDLKKQIPTENVTYVPNGVDLSEIKSNRYSKSNFLKEHDLPADSFIVGHVGRFHPVKNHEKLFGIFKEVYQKRPNARLVLVGSGSPQETARIEALKQEHGLSDAVLMLGIRRDATAIMSVFDAFVLPSFSEGFPLVILEAQAHGVRCVVSNVVPPEAICENCVALSVQDPDEAWANAILSADPPPLTNPIEAFDIKNVTKALQDLYTAAVKS